MPRVSEIVVAIEAEGEERVLAALKQVDGAQIKSVQNTKQLGAQTKQATEQASAGWATLVTGVNQAIGVLQTVVQVGKAVYDFTKQGAQLEFMAGKFERLALAAGSTADVLLNDLRKATQGTRSDMELMASAGDFMSLGLAKTSEEVVRLTTVAGALNMDMNQLVLTLANQTTQRFDQLGVSVDGFEEKVKSLKAAGLSANDAFKEAFLQQAEEQVRKVGNAADASIGGFMQMEAAFKNLGDAIKNDFAQSLEGVIPLMTQLAVGMVETQRRGVEYRDVMSRLDSAQKAGVISGAEYSRMLAEMGVHSNAGSVSAAALQKALEFLDGAYQGYAGTVDMTAEKTIALEIELAKEKLLLDQTADAASGAGEAVESFAVSSESAAFAVDNFLEKAGIFKADFEEIFDLSNNLNEMVSFATTYDGLMDQIAAKEAERAKLIAQGWSATGSKVRGVTEEIEALNAELANIPKTMTFDLFSQAIQANGKVTRAEFQALMDMGVELGLYSQDAADKSMAAWDDVMKGVNDWEIDPKTGDVTLKLNTEEVDDYQPETKKGLVEWLIDQTRVDAWQPPDKVGRVTYNVTNVPGTVWEETRAIGGPVYPNNTYLWQEPNREGELFVPEQYGRVMNNHQVAQAIRDAMFASTAGGGRTGGAVTTDNSRHITYNINAQYKQEPVLTLSQHLKILSTLGGRA